MPAPTDTPCQCPEPTRDPRRSLQTHFTRHRDGSIDYRVHCQRCGGVTETRHVPAPDPRSTPEATGA